MAVARQRTSVWQLEIPLRALECLYRGLFIDAQNDRLLRRRHVKTDDICGFARKVRIIALAPALAATKIDLLFAQGSPDVLHTHIAQRFGDQGPAPTREPFGRRPIKDFADAFVGGCAIDRWCSRARQIYQPIKTLTRKATAPQADRGRRRLQYARNLACAGAFGGVQDDLEPQHVALLGCASAKPGLQLVTLPWLQPDF